MFSGGLGSKRKAELQDIAVALKLSKDGTNEQLQARIKKHLEDNAHKLEENPKFAGLYGKRRKASVQPQDVALPTSVGSSNRDSGDESPHTSPSRVTRASAHKTIVALDSVEEIASPRSSPVAPRTPGTELRNVSAMLKRGAETDHISPSASLRLQGRFSRDEDEDGRNLDEDEDDKLENQNPALLHQKTPTKTPATLATPKKLAKAAEKKVVREGSKVLERTSMFLSNARNIWTTTVVLEFLSLFFSTVPIQWVPVGSSTVNVPLPSFTETNPVACKILLHWAIPTVIAPLLLGNLIIISRPYAPSNTGILSPPRSLTQRILTAPRRLYQSVDPRSAAIVRLAIHYMYPYASFDVTLPGKVLTAEVSGSEGPAHEMMLVQAMDVLGREWRLWSASVGLAFAFAENKGYHAPSTQQPTILESETQELVTIERT